MTGVVIVRERCASEDPPAEGSIAWTSYGAPLVYMRWTTFQDPSDDDDEGVERLGWYTPDGTGGMAWAVPQPRVWFDFPRDTERETLTTGHIRVLTEAAEYVAAEHDSGAGEDDLLVQAAARLRAALDALNTSP